MPEAILYKTFNNKIYYLIFVAFAALLFAGQLFINRAAFTQLLSWQIVLHLLFIFFYYKRQLLSLKQIIVGAIILRLGSAVIMPSLSDDIYRFIWDGQLAVHFQNPLLTTPDNYLAELSSANPNYNYFKELHGLINHPQFYTCYPPLMQMVFFIAAFIGGNSIIISSIIIKLLVGFSDVIGIVFLTKILKKIKYDPTLVVLYALNPLVIIEGTGNAHFEVMQVALIIVSIYFILQNKWWLAAIFWGCAIVTKLLPLLLLPLIIRLLGFKKGILFCLIAVTFAALSFLPFISIQSIHTFSKSLNLYFQNFEFNASIYYVAREIGWWVKGYNYISFIGPLLMVIFLIIYGVIFFYKRKYTLNDFSSVALIVLTFYYFFATTVHPWYIINLLPFALLSNKRFAFVWMAAAFISYNAYSDPAFKENYILLAIEYTIVLVAAWFSFRNSGKNKQTKEQLS